MKVLIVTALYPRPENPAWGAFVRAQEETLAQFGVHTDVMVINGTSSLQKYWKSLFDLRKWLNHGTYDVIHAHYNYPALIARTQHRVPVVMTLHGSDLQGRIGADGTHEAISVLDKWLSQFLSLTCEGTTVQSKLMQGMLPRNDSFIVPMEIDLDLFHPMERQAARQQLGLDPDRRYLLFAANPQEARKGFPFSGAVYERLKQRFRDLDFLVVYKEPQQRLMLYLNASDALIFPSYQEGSPVVVKQSMACNLPVVATGVGDIPEMIGNTPGCAVCPRDVDVFTEELAAILENPRRTNGRQDVQRFSRKATFDKLMEVYTYAIERFRARRPIPTT
ncbi:MAG: glycosyltransferase family 4 protein [Chloroflexaceae bacterium]|nr:glycosyltransferase family 4 protein [Chloroflexaceae bacterium]NJL33566.1 glycosyltransferase family 4 protein [Chloroflexaceae bacterium]NJO05058.1 glycosyltransferase family 4 protein [Chloroflexaceae bacterium]